MKNPKDHVISKAISEIKFGLTLADVFRAKYESKLPPDLGYFTIYSGRPQFTINLEFEGLNRDKILTLLGDVFGRSEWEAALEYRGRHFNWSKTVDGCQLLVGCAQKLDQPEKFPVDPRQFPLQLEDSPLILNSSDEDDDTPF